MCPPNTPNIDYRLVLKEYSELLIVYGKIPFQEPMHEFLRRQSSNMLHRILLKAEKLLWEEDYPLAVSFTGGSCKLCAKGCDPQRCRQPNIARIPLESTGINVIKSAKNIGIDVVFPPREYIYRLGLLGW
jgi:predicted metal-binding protein